MIPSLIHSFLNRMQTRHSILPEPNLIPPETISRQPMTSLSLEPCTQRQIISTWSQATFYFMLKQPCCNNRGRGEHRVRFCGNEKKKSNLGPELYKLPLSHKLFFFLCLIVFHALLPRHVHAWYGNINRGGLQESRVFGHV